MPNEGSVEDDLKHRKRGSCRLNIDSFLKPFNTTGSAGGMLHPWRSHRGVILGGEVRAMIRMLRHGNGFHFVTALLFGGINVLGQHD